MYFKIWKRQVSLNENGNLLYWIGILWFNVILGEIFNSYFALNFKVHTREVDLEDRYILKPRADQKHVSGDIYGDVNEVLEVRPVLSQPQVKVRKVTPHPEKIVTDLDATEIVTMIENPEYNL